MTLMLNPTAEDRKFRLPEPRLPTRLLVDSADPTIEAHDVEGVEVAVGARDTVVLIAEVGTAS